MSRILTSRVAIRHSPLLSNTSHRAFSSVSLRSVSAFSTTPFSSMAAAGEKLEKLRAQLETHSVDYYVIPTADCHQSEFVASCDERRPWISGFTGSMGTVVVPRAKDQKALLWADGRYWIQAENELDAKHWSLVRMGAPKVKDLSTWLATETPVGARIGFDPAYVTLGQMESWKAAALKEEQKSQTSNRVKFVGVTPNLVDEIWTDQPSRPANPIVPHPMKYSGETVASKVNRLRKKLHNRGTEALLVQSLDSVAWLLNLRGQDIPFNPVFFSYALVVAPKPAEGEDAAPVTVRWYVRSAQVTEEVTKHLETESQAGQEESKESEASWPAVDIQIREYDQFMGDVSELRRMGAKAFQSGKPIDGASPARVWVDPSRSTVAVQSAVVADLDVAQEKGRPVDLVYDETPISILKSVKNDVEIEGMRQCHLRDAVAVCQYIRWLETAVATNPDKKAYNECTVADKLEDFRSKQADFRGLSFPTISSSGPNGAVIHYGPQPETASPVNDEMLYLVDSGGQYLDGTTDITRTLHLGQPTPAERESFTRVLQGHIDLALAVFPAGTKGPTLDILARLPLWKAGQNYGHGTGHGVGSYLNVHEGPQSISPRGGVAMKTALESGMTVTDEPGYYESGEYGIRIESVLVVKKKDTPYRYLETQFFGFENVTFVPMDRKLIVGELLTPEQKEWVDSYHALCLENVGPLLKEQGLEDTHAWLVENTKPMFQ